MGVNLCCPKCYKSYKLKTTKCNCGANLKKEKLFRVRLKLPNGKWKSKLVRTLDLAQKVEAKYKTQAVEEDVFDIHRAPFIDPIWEKYLKWAKMNKRSWEGDRTRWETHINHHVNGMKMNKITPYDIQKVLNQMYTRRKANGKPYAPATIKQVLVLIKRVFNWSIKQGFYHGTNPCNSIEAPRFDNKCQTAFKIDPLSASNFDPPEVKKNITLCSLISSFHFLFL